MNPLKKAAKDYIGLRRSLGFKMASDPGKLASFISFMNARGASHITTRLALQWAQENPEIKPITVAGRLTCLRGFATYLSAKDPRTQIPQPGLLPYYPKRARPYLYSEAEVQRLLKAALDMGGLHGFTHYCFLGLLSVTGMRISEVFNLRPQDVDLRQGILSIVRTKFAKSRLVPIHSTTQAMLAKYAQHRGRHFRRQLSYFFVNQWGNRLAPGNVRPVFHRLSYQVGLRTARTGRGPRLHDFRHNFAVRTLVGWYRSGQNIEDRLPTLTTYLGHTNVSDTYWYLSNHPELMRVAIKRFEQHWEESV